MEPISMGFMLALQASGMVVDWLGKNEQVRLGKMGNQVEQAGINSNIQTARLQAEDESLQSMKALRMNLGTQAAMLAAKGVGGASGASIYGTNESIGNFNADERMRRINQKSNEAALRAGSLISNLHQKTFESKTWGQFRQNVINNIPTTPEAWSKIWEGFSAKNGYGFGLTKIGS